MSTTRTPIRAMLLILFSFIGIMIYKFIVNGPKEALLFAPLVGILLLVILVVYIVTKRKHTPNA